MKAIADHWHWCSLETRLTIPDCPLGACRGSPNLLRVVHYRMELLFIHARWREMEETGRGQRKEKERGRFPVSNSCVCAHH